MKTTKGQETRKKIIEESEKLFFEKSVSKVTINDIVKRAGVAKGTFYLYFDSKDALVWEFIDHKLNKLNNFLIEIGVEGYKDEDIEKIITYIVSFVKANRVIINLLHHVKFSSFIGFDNMENKWLKKWIELIYVWLEKGQLQGEIKVENTKFLAYFLVVTIHEVLERAIIEKNPFTIDEVSEEIKKLIIKMLK